MNFAQLFEMIHVAITLAPVAEKLIADLDLVIHKYVGPDIAEFDKELRAALAPYLKK
jgi:hypothetical protein